MCDKQRQYIRKTPVCKGKNSEFEIWSNLVVAINVLHQMAKQTGKPSPFLTSGYPMIRDIHQFRDHWEGILTWN